MRRVAADGWSHVIRDGKLFNTDRLAETTVSVNGAAIDVGRRRTLRHSTASPRQVGDILRAALHLTHYEYRYLPESC